MPLEKAETNTGPGGQVLHTSVSFLIGIDQNYSLKEWIIYHYQNARFHTFVPNLNV